MGCLRGLKNVIQDMKFLLTRSNKMHTKFFSRKHDTADSKPDVLKTSSLYRSAYVQWNERYILFLCI